MTAVRPTPVRLFAAIYMVFVTGCLYPYSETAEFPNGRTCPGPSPAGVTWLFSTEEADNRRLEDWCVTVGPALIDSVPFAPFDELETADSVAIVAWNTNAGAGHLMAFLRDELGLDCSGPQPQLAVAATHFVLLLQEALRRSNDIPLASPQWAIPPPVAENPHPGPRLDVTEVAVRCGLSLFYAAGARNGHAQRDGKREDKGVAILSTLPLSDFIAVELPYEAARRVAVAATVHGPRGDSLRVVSVHLVSVTPVWRIFRTGNSSRQRQALAVVDALRVAERLRAGPANSAAQESVPCCEQREGALASYAIATVVAGDLNTWSTRETALRHLLDHFPQSPRPLAESTRGPFPTDHIFFRVDGTGEGARVLDSTYRRIDDTYYSDHNPIVALLSFHRPPRDSGARSISKKDGG